MNALLLVANVIAMHTTEAPVVLDGCNNASARRAAAIAAMPAEDPDTLASIADLLREPDGAVCLMESWTLVKVYNAQPDAGLIAHTLVAGMGSEAPHIAARAAHLVRVLGVGDAFAFMALVHRADMTTAAWHNLRVELAGMPESNRKIELAIALDGAMPLTATSEAR